MLAALELLLVPSQLVLSISTTVLKTVPSGTPLLWPTSGCLQKWQTRRVTLRIHQCLTLLDSDKTQAD